MNTYEGLFIFSDALKDNALDEAVGRARTEIEKVSGVVKSTTRLGRRPFARPLRGREAGQYFLITFDIDPRRLGGLQGRYKLSEDIFRVQIVRAEIREPAAAKEPAADSAAGAKKG
ncbi:MAG: 30S ribosomal protein S6 [Kiritimatiellae bacterium]|nr:30S ribosomal protein S6 [Kiritimatiellia bacterium]